MENSNNQVSAPAQGANGMAMNQQSYPVQQPSAEHVMNRRHQSSGDSTRGKVFSSNPFQSLGKGLASIYSANPRSGVTINFYAFIVMALYILTVLSALAGGTNLYVVMMIATTVIGILVFLRIYLATLMIFNKSYVGETVTAKEAFREGVKGKVGKLILASLISILAILGGFILLAIPGFILMARLSLVPFVVYNEDIGGIKAFKRSMVLTKNHTFEMFGALFAGGLAGGDGIIGAVISQAPLANRYYELVEIEKGELQSTKVDSWNYILTIIPATLMVLGAIFAIYSASQVSKSGLNGSNLLDEYDGGSILDQYCEPTNDFYFLYKDDCVDGKYVNDLSQ